MGNVLDAIRKKNIIDGDTLITVDWVSESLSLDDIEGPFAIQLDYELGITPDMDFVLETSIDGITYVPVIDGNTSTLVTINDTIGTHLWDIGALGGSKVRVAITVRGGSITLTKLFFNGRRRH
jgi:hypothetical protein